MSAVFSCMYPTSRATQQLIGVFPSNGRFYHGRSKLRKRMVAAGALAVILTASVHALTTDFVELAGIETPLLVQAAINPGQAVDAQDKNHTTPLLVAAGANQGPQTAKVAPSKGKGYAELFCGGGTSQLNNGWYAMTDADGYDNISSLPPAISTDSFDAIIGVTYYWSLNSRLWWGAGFTFIYPFIQTLNGATTIGGALAFGVGPSGQNQPSNWFTAPTVFSFDAPFRIALTPDVLITLTPSLLGAVIYDNSLDVTYFGIGASGSVGLTWYFSERFGTSASVGYRYIYSLSNTYSAPFVSDTMYNTYANNGFFGMAGLVFRF